MTSKEKLQADARALYRVNEAAEMLGTTTKDILREASKNDAQLLSEIKEGAILYCSSSLSGACCPEHGKYDWSQPRTKPLFKAAKAFDYLALDANQYLTIMGTGELTIDTFNLAAALDLGSGEVIFTSAPQFAMSNKISPHLAGNRQAIFSLFASEPVMLHNEMLNVVMREKISIQVKIADLWITKPTLLDVLSKLPEAPSQNDIPLHGWMDVRLKILNRACVHFFGNRDNSDIITTENDRTAIKNFIQNEHIKALEKPIKVTPLRHAVDVVRPDYQGRNMAIYATAEATAIYPHCFSQALINMNEISRQLYEEHKEKLEKYSRSKKVRPPVPPTRDQVIERSKQIKALPARMIEHLVSLMLPNY